MTDTPARKPPQQKTARKAPAKKALAKAPAKDAPAKETGQTQPPGSMAIANQAAFCQALGLDPDLVVANSVTVEFSQQGVALVRYSAYMPVAPHELGFAFMASAGVLGSGAGSESTGQTDLTGQTEGGTEA